MTEGCQERRARARECCAGLREALWSRLPASVEIVFGPDAEDSPEPVVAELRRRGAHFFWVAVPLGEVTFWEAHVGVVVDPQTLHGRAGVHFGRGSAPAARLSERLDALLGARGLVRVVSEVVNEEQWNGPLHDLAEAGKIGRASDEVVGLLREARRHLSIPL